MSEKNVNIILGICVSIIIVLLLCFGGCVAIKNRQELAKNQNAFEQLQSYQIGTNEITRLKNNINNLLARKEELHLEIQELKQKQFTLKQELENPLFTPAPLNNSTQTVIIELRLIK